MNIEFKHDDSTGKTLLNGKIYLGYAVPSTLPVMFYHICKNFYLKVFFEDTKNNFTTYDKTYIKAFREAFFYNYSVRVNKHTDGELRKDVDKEKHLITDDEDGIIVYRDGSVNAYEF